MVAGCAKMVCRAKTKDTATTNIATVGFTNLSVLMTI